MDIKKVRLGKTGLWVTKTAMGCLPIQRISKEAAITLLRKAYDNGINGLVRYFQPVICDAYMPDVALLFGIQRRFIRSLFIFRGRHNSRVMELEEVDVVCLQPF